MDNQGHINENVFTALDILKDQMEILGKQVIGLSRQNKKLELDLKELRENKSSKLFK